MIKYHALNKPSTIRSTTDRVTSSISAVSIFSPHGPNVMIDARLLYDGICSMPRPDLTILAYQSCDLPESP